MSDEEFIDNHILKQIEELINDRHYNASFLLMAQSIEVLGAYMDNKPLKAENQSKIRFRQAIYRLFPPSYARENRSDTLYRQFRSSLTHALIPSKHLSLVNNQGDLHLKHEKGKLIINAESLYNDIKIAAGIIKKRLKSGEIRRKRVL